MFLGPGMYLTEKLWGCILKSHLSILAQVLDLGENAGACGQSYAQIQLHINKHEISHTPTQWQTPLSQFAHSYYGLRVPLFCIRQTAACIANDSSLFPLLHVGPKQLLILRDLHQQLL